jgi:beta-glucosidase
LGTGRDQDAVTLFDGIKAQDPNTTFAQGCQVLDNDPPDPPNDECGSDAGFDQAVATAKAADQVVLALGDSGGAESRSNIDLPGKQQELIDRIKATGKPFVVVLFNGRPLTLEKVDASAPAILEAWFPGVQPPND